MSKLEIANKSHSNYNQTVLSLGSSLNMQYLDEMLILDPQTDDRKPAQNLIRNNYVSKFLKEERYRIFAFDSGFDMTNMTSSDVYLERKKRLNMFEEVLLNNSLAVFSIKLLMKPVHREAMLNQFDRNGNLLEENYGDLSHADGDHFTGSKEDYQKGYYEQVLYANYRIEIVIDKILAHPGPKPIIVIQGDHGSRLLLDHGSLEKTCSWERFSILNAYYLPEDGEESLYPEITPVYTFRIIFNNYFNARLPKTDDISYYSSWEKPFQFQKIMNQQIEKPCKFEKVQ